MAKKVTRIVTWVCDKPRCSTRNTREINYNDVINDDICDFCHCAIHEPNTVELAIRNTKKRRNNDN